MRDEPVSSQGSGRLKVGEWMVHPALDRIEHGDESVKLEPRTMRLLLALAERRGDVVLTEELLATVWKDVVVTPSSVYEVVAQLRKALGETADGTRYIETVPRKGYRLVAPVAIPDPAAARVTAVAPSQVRLPPAATRDARKWLVVSLALAVVCTLAWRALTPARQTPPPAVAVPATPAGAPAAQDRAGSVLWVDDKPENNVREREALESFRLDVELATSTESALTLLASSKVDVVISDMHRPGDPVAGYTLLQSLRARGDQTPFVIYTSSCEDAEMIEARSRGALGCATKISEVMQAVLAALEARR